MGIIKSKYVFLFLCLCGLVVLASPGTGRADHIRFYVDGLPPYAVLQDQGPPTGFAVDLMGRLMHSVGEHFAPTDIKVMTWARAVHEVEVVPGTALLVLAKLPERLGRFKWVGPLDTLPIGVLARKDSGITVQEIGDLKEHSIGMVRNTAPYLVLINTLPGLGQNLVLLSGIPAQLRMLREGRVDLIVQAVDASNRLMDEEGMESADYHVVYRFEPLRIYFGFNKSTDDRLIRRLQAALDRFKEGDSSGTSPYDRLRQEYFGWAAPDSAEKAEAQ